MKINLWFKKVVLLMGKLSKVDRYQEVLVSECIVCFRKTQAFLREVANVIANFHLEESSGVLSKEEERWIVRCTSDSTPS